MASARVPDSRTIPIPPVPGGVAMAAMVSGDVFGDVWGDAMAIPTDSGEPIETGCGLLTGPGLDTPGDYPLLCNR